MISTTIDEARVEAFLGQIAVEIGASLNTALVVLGDRLGLYRAMADAQPVSAAELAARTSTHERYVCEWLNAQAACGFVEYAPASDTYTLPAEHAFVLADETSPAAKAGIFQAATAAINGSGRIAERFRSGDGLGWGEHEHGLFWGTERAFAANYRAALVASWLPALNGVTEKLRAGASVADIGCGHGASTILMAQAFPRSRFVGIDAHEQSIATARERAAQAGVADRVTFMADDARSFTAGPFDLIAFFDALHDMGDPVGAARHARDRLTEDGVCMIVEPFAGDSIEENLTPVGRLFYGMSTLVCTPGALSQQGGTALGTQAGEQRLADVLRAGGFATVRRAAETPLNLVLEARP
jgi:SAM-dependent methyltransferase